MGIIPNKKPQIERGKVEKLLEGFGIKDPVVLVGIRGYFRNTMGEKGKNDRGIYDDAIVLLGPQFYATFIANCDPYSHVAGHGKKDGTKGIADLKAGNWLYKIGLHKGQYKALIQADMVTVLRDADRFVPEKEIIIHEGRRTYSDHGYFGINIHKGGYTKVSSVGCQTIYPDLWESFIASVQAQMKVCGYKQIHYLLVENDGSIA